MFFITKKELNFFPEKTIATIRKIIRNSYEVDFPPEIDPEEMDQMHKEWNTMKETLIENSRREKFVKKRNFPFN